LCRKKILSNSHHHKLVQSHWTYTESGTLMSSHCKVQSSTPSKIRQHTNCSTKLPIILSWNSLKILVRKRLPDRSELLICFTICDSKNGCDSLNQERLRKFECVCINLLHVHLMRLNPKCQSQHRWCRKKRREPGMLLSNFF